MNRVLPRVSARFSQERASWRAALALPALTRRPTVTGLTASVALTALMALSALTACGNTGRGAGASGQAALAAATAPMSVSAGRAAAHTPTATFILLGEVHDNPAHHQARAELLRRLLAEEPSGAVVVEQIDRSHDDAVAQARRAQPGAVEPVLDAGQFDRKGWGWPLHQPVFDVVVHSAASLHGGNLGRDEIRRIVREGDGAWPQDLLALRQRTAWTPAQQQTLVREIQDGHCGAMPDAMLPGMVEAQRARDAAMAQAMLAARSQGARRVILIAGNGHVRRDVAVPVYLQAAGVAASDIDAVAYLETDSAAAAGTYDAVERAPAPARADPCAAFKR